MAQVGKENLKTGKELKELPLTSLTVYDPERRKRQGSQTYYLKLRNKELTSGEFAKWFRKGEKLHKSYRVQLNELFKKIKDGGIKLYFAQDFYVSSFAFDRGEKFVEVEDRRLNLKIVAIKNGKLSDDVPDVGSSIRIPEPLEQRSFDFDDAPYGKNGRYFDEKFFKKGDMGYRIAGGDAHTEGR